jgi:hypothetical protein
MHLIHAAKTKKNTISGAQKWPKNAVQKRATKGHKKGPQIPIKKGLKTAPKSTIVAASWPKRALSSARQTSFGLLESAQNTFLNSGFFEKYPI